MAEKEGKQATIQEVQAVKDEVERYLSQGNALKALQSAIANPPNAKDEKVKDLAGATVTQALAAIGEGDIAKTLNDLNAEEQNTVMKYVYKGMSLGANCAALLKWHSALYERNGAGIIMRAMVDRKI